LIHLRCRGGRKRREIDVQDIDVVKENHVSCGIDTGGAIETDRPNNLPPVGVS
jgi:hypothetical protein